MPSLSRNLRKDLEKAVRDARQTAEAGARKALEQLGVSDREAPQNLTPQQKTLRNRLRAHGRQLGDALDPQRGTQAVIRLTSEVAYEHWHRMLFARFLADNDLLIEPESGMPITLDECRELARHQGKDWLPVACAYAEGMLPQIFRRGDPVLEVSLPAETRSELEDILKAQPREVFVADDSLGWVYQFWQADRKDDVNQSEKKIGADELPAVTQLFTEDYMVEFLLHNTLGAWWAGRVAQTSSLHGESEEAVRQSVALPGLSWTYLRFVRNAGDQSEIGNQKSEIGWRPAAGTFTGWPKSAKELRVLDPCMGSGHFLVIALLILVALRRKEEGLSAADAIKAVLHDNLFGLEIDPRCTQIAAFNLALAAWKLGGYQKDLTLHLACSGLSVGAEKEAWLKLADRTAARSPFAGDPQLFGGEGNLADNLRSRLRFGMGQLYDLFRQAPILGSLLNPRSLHGVGLLYDWDELSPLLDEALAAETGDDESSEIAVAAKGLAKAANILAGRFTLVATNVPYLGRGKHDDVLKDYCERFHAKAKADLATCFVERCMVFCADGGTIALVTPQNWLFLGTYKALRERLLNEQSWNVVARLGPKSFQTPMWDFNIVLVTITCQAAAVGHAFAGLDVAEEKAPGDKAAVLAEQSPAMIGQRAQLNNPDFRVTLTHMSDQPILGKSAEALVGLQTSDDPRFIVAFWDVASVDKTIWEFLQSTPDRMAYCDGMSWLVRWEQGKGVLLSLPTAYPTKGLKAMGRQGVAIHRMGAVFAYYFGGERFHQNVAVLVPHDPSHLPAIWCMCVSPSYCEAVGTMDQALKITNATLAKVPFDLAHWQKVAAEKYPYGLPKPLSSDPTQWLFNGHPKGADQPLQVAVARLLGYQWPRQTGSSFPDCPALDADRLESHVDADGIVPLSPLRGEASAADRLNGLLAAAYGKEWSAAKLRELLTAAGAKSDPLDAWLRDDFSDQHCALFHQRPFVWHIWDGLKDGFNALVNYHRLAAPNGGGKRTLEKLIYTYLGDWIDAQRKGQKIGVEGADSRLTAAEHLRRQLEAILVGEPPFDLFIRWKQLHQQPIGWNPDINDGIRLNIRPFMTATPLNARGKNACILRITPKNLHWEKDRGKEPQSAKADFPWFWGWDEATADFTGGSTFDGNRWNDCHYSAAAKQAARDRHGK